MKNQQNLGQKLKYRIVSVSSEDEGYPASELYQMTPSAKGWQSARFCDYPQEMIIEFPTPIQIQQLQFLSHQSKVCQKVDIYVQASLQMGKNIADQKFKKLGYLSLDSNERSNYQARELKTVYIDIKTQFVKILFNKCHVNKYNLFNQVGVVAIGIYGQPMDTEKVSKQAMQHLEYEMQYDQVTLDQLRQIYNLRTISKQKEQAVKNEDYAEAKRLKEIEDNLKKAGQQLLFLEEKKQTAIQNEDYESAMILKNEIQKIRNTFQAPQQPQTKLQRFNQENIEIQNNSQFFQNDRPQQNQEPYQNQMQNQNHFGYPQNQQNPQYPTSPKDQFSQPRGQQQNFDMQQQMNQQPMNPMEQYQNQYNALQQSVNKSYNQQNFQKQQEMQHPQQEEVQMAHDDVPIKPMGNVNFDNANDSRNDGNNDQNDLPQLSGSKQKFAEQFAPAFGMELCQKIFADKWNLKSEAFVEIEELSESQISQNQLIDLIGVLSILIGDKNVQAVNKTLSILNNLFSRPEKINRTDYQDYNEKILQTLLEKIGDNNARTRESAIQLYMTMSANSNIGPQHCSGLLINAQTKGKLSGAKYISSRLVILSQLVQQSVKSLDCAGAINFAVKQIENQSQEVRNNSVQLITDIYAGGFDVFPYLGNVKAPQMEIINQSIETAQPKPKQQKQNNKQEAPQQKKPQQKAPEKKQPEVNQSNNEIYEIEEENNTQCEFCDKVDENFLDPNKFDMHLWKECVMLGTCELCLQVVENASLNQHLLEECKNRKTVKQCPRCQLAVRQDVFNSHVEAGNCAIAKNPNQANTCYLCKNHIPGGDDGFKIHYINEKCKKNERVY